MGCGIHSFVEQRRDGRWQRVDFDGGRARYENGPFGWRSYGMFGFLAGVRNYSAVPPIAEPRGMPSDASADVEREYENWGFDAHTASWLSVAELAGFDYDAAFEDRRVTRQMPGGGSDGGVTCAPGEGKRLTFREFLAGHFFDDLERLKALGAPVDTRVVFWFDN